MPNWCYIDFTVSGRSQDISRFREAVRGGEKGEIPFDFNRLGAAPPVPTELSNTINDGGVAFAVYYGDAESVLRCRWVQNLGIASVEQLREHFDADPKHRATADLWRANIEKYGVPTLCEWRSLHWGTDRNAFDADIAENGAGSLRVTFETAWDFPTPIFEKLVAEFPTLIFEGSAEEPNTEMYISFRGCNGEFRWQEDHDALKAAAAIFEDPDAISVVTA
jgi:hypothetical protein